MKILLGLLTLVSTLVAQSPNQTVSQFFYDGSGNQKYICTAPAVLPSNLGSPFNSVALPSTISVALGSLTNIVVSGGTATVSVPSGSLWNAGTYTDLVIYVSGSATAALNGSYQVTNTNTNTTTFTFTTTASNGTYTDASISTNNPLLTQVAWNLIVLTYNTSNQATGTLQINQGYTVPCSVRSNY